jgi:hypothetical protein
MNHLILPFKKNAAIPGGASHSGTGWFLLVLAVLVGDAAAGLAGGLARGLALAAAAVLGALAEVAGLKGGDLDHDLPPLYLVLPWDYTTARAESQGFQIANLTGQSERSSRSAASEIDFWEKPKCFQFVQI